MKRIIIGIVFFVVSGSLFAQTTIGKQISSFSPANPNKTWVFWYWMQAAISKEGITADLEAMKENGIAGAYLMPIKGVANPPLLEPAAPQLSPRFWEMVKFAMEEAKRLHLQIGMHFSDGFALGGGPWITPDISMQKITWRKTMLPATGNKNIQLQQPDSYKGYYKRIAVFAYPTPVTNLDTAVLVVSTSTGQPANFLLKAEPGQSFKSSDNCWIQYSYSQPFTARSIHIKTSGNNYQAERLLLQTSKDGVTFENVQRLQAPRHGWQDTDADFTYSIAPVTAKYFRFVYDKKGTEPGSEDLDAAKWKPVLKLTELLLRAEPAIHQYEAKAGYIWRVAERTTATQLPNNLCIPVKQFINITSQVDASGQLQWKAPAGNWTILEIGHTSTGQTNATGGAAAGLECDKFSESAIRLQFNSWFGEAIKQVGEPLAKEVLKVFHLDSWECGSQNWSQVFAAEFKKRRGYDLMPYLPAMTGLPVESAEVSERFLYDVRQTIAELVNDVFYTTLQKLSHEKDCLFTAESVAPTMVSDGLLHYSKVDVPMGEYWLNSPTHDKPNDMLDAISGAHIYGKPIVQSESFTTVRMAWDEHPGMMKTLMDRNYAMGINRVVYHVFAHNPWVERKPGMTLDGVGLYFQRNQTWWKPAKAWVEYAERCHGYLQQGVPVRDIAVFIGDEFPRRSILPDRLVNTLPGLFGKQRVATEKIRLANDNEPVAEMPAGVWHSANMAKAEDWINPLNGYQYDCINSDALLRLATVKNKKIVLPGGASYSLLVLPFKTPMLPSDNRMNASLLAKIEALVKQGASVLIPGELVATTGLQNSKAEDLRLKQIYQRLTSGSFTKTTGANGEAVWVKKYGAGKVVRGAYNVEVLTPVGVERDFDVTEAGNTEAFASIAYTHRETSTGHIYFVANQQEKERQVTISFRVTDKQPQIVNPVTGDTIAIEEWSMKNGRTYITTRLDANGSFFVVFDKTAKEKQYRKSASYITLASTTVLTDWAVQFDTAYGGPAAPIQMKQLASWSQSNDSSIRYYSGTAVYKKQLVMDKKNSARVLLQLGKVANIAQVKVNGKDVATLWTYPFEADITKALMDGSNDIEISVTNTWANRLIGDSHLPVEKRLTNTTAPFRLAGKPLLDAGLLGPVALKIYK